MCGDIRENHSLAALVEIVGDEQKPLSTVMRRLCLSRLRELQRTHEMLRLVTGRDDWQRMTVDDLKTVTFCAECGWGWNQHKPGCPAVRR